MKGCIGFVAEVGVAEVCGVVVDDAADERHVVEEDGAAEAAGDINHFWVVVGGCGFVCLNFRCV